MSRRPDLCKMYFPSIIDSNKIEIEKIRIKIVKNIVQ